MGRSSTVELRFLVPAVGGSNPSVPALKNIALQAHMDPERFFVGKRRDSNPQGCGAEETRSVFQRSTQGAKRRSGPRPPKRRTQNPSVPALKNIALQALLDPERFFVGKRRDSNPPGCGAEETRSVFQRSTQGAKRCSGPRPPAGGRGIPPSHISQSRFLGHA